MYSFKNLSELENIQQEDIKHEANSIDFTTEDGNGNIRNQEINPETLSHLTEKNSDYIKQLVKLPKGKSE